MFGTSPKFRRTELLRNNEIPTQSEIKHFLGANLAHVFCQFSHPNIKQYLGVTPPLQGTDEKLWMSPSDQLIGKVCLKLPPTQKYIRVCTHDGILQLGEQAKQRWVAQTTEKLRDELKNNLKETFLMLEAEKRHAVNLAIRHTKNLYEIHTNNIAKEHEKQLEYSIARATANSNEKLQRIVSHERMKIKREMMKKLRDEIGYVIVHLCKEFDRESRAQKEIMISEFNEILRQEREMADNKLRDFHQRRIEDFQHLKIELDNEFCAREDDIIYAERINMRAQHHSLYQCYEKKIEALEDLLLEAKFVIELLGEIQRQSRSSNFSWLRKLHEIIRQIQKFVEVAFKFVPDKTELISLLETLLCEILGKEIRSTEGETKLDAMKNEKRKFGRSPIKNEVFHVIEIIDKNGEKWRPIQLLPDTPQLYCTEEQLLSPIVKSNINICHDDDYIDNNSVNSRSTLATNDSLPFVNFKNKMYVRSDYKPDTEESSVEMKTMAELAEDSHFVLGLNDSGPCNILIADIKDDPLSSAYNKKQKHNIDDEESLLTEFEERVKNLIKAIQYVKNKSSNTNRKFTRYTGDRFVRDLMNYSKTAKNSKETSDQSPATFEVNKIPPIKQMHKQLACERVKSIIKLFRLNPSLQNILIQTANNIQVNK